MLSPRSSQLITVAVSFVLYSLDVRAIRAKYLWR